MPPGNKDSVVKVSGPAMVPVHGLGFRVEGSGLGFRAEGPVLRV